MTVRNEQYWAEILARNVSSETGNLLAKPRPLFRASGSRKDFVAALSMFARATESISYLSKAKHQSFPQLQVSLSKHLDDLEGIIREKKSWWSHLNESSQEIVEASSLVLGLLGMSGEILLRARHSAALVDWVRQLRMANTKDNNWFFFSLVLDSFLDEDPDKTRRDVVASFDSPLFDQETGWFRDGPDGSYDYYSSFVAHYIPHLLLILDPDTTQRELEQGRFLLERYLRGLSHLIHPSGAPVLFGRSAHYTTAIVAPFSILALLSDDDREQFKAGSVVGQVYRYFSRNIGTLGFPAQLSWGYRSNKLVENYSLPGSTLWSNRIFAPLLFHERQQSFWKGMSHSGRQKGEPALSDFLSSQANQPTPFLTNNPRGSSPAVIIGNGHNMRTSRLRMGRKIQDRFDRLAYSSHTEPVRSGKVCDNSWFLTRNGATSRLIPLVPLACPPHIRRFRVGIETLGSQTPTGDLGHTILETRISSGKRVDTILLSPDWEGGTIVWTGWAVGNRFGFASITRSQSGFTNSYSILGQSVETTIEMDQPHQFRANRLISAGVFAKFFTVARISFDTNETNGSQQFSFEVSSSLRLRVNN